MKSKSGVTLALLAIILVIMSLLVTVVVANGSEIFNTTNKTKFESEISQIEILVNNYVRRNSGIDFATTQLDISSYTEIQKEQFEGENIVDNKIQLYVISLDKIDAKEVYYGSGDKGARDRYLYSDVTKKVYYEQGITIGETIYHRIGN